MRGPTYHKVLSGGKRPVRELFDPAFNFRDDGDSCFIFIVLIMPKRTDIHSVLAGGTARFPFD
jgi:hypothetical protein